MKIQYFYTRIQKLSIIFSLTTLAFLKWHTPKINPAKAGGFSRKPFYLNSSLLWGRYAKSLMYGSLNEKHPNNTSNHLYNEVVAMTKNKYPHFNPEVHKIESKIATVWTSHHCKYNINYHIIWIPKYRKPILVGKVREVLKTIMN